MTSPSPFWRSSIGSKAIMAVTGLLLFGFVVGHLVGNLQLLLGRDAINSYAKWLHDTGPLLWVARVALLAVFVVHIAMAIRLSRANRAARPVPYVRKEAVVATFASRSMLFSGLTLLVFVVYHVLHFTLGFTNPEHYALRSAGAQGFDVHAMVTASFRVPAIVVAYVIGQIVLFLHLKHGIQSMAQTLGIHHGRYLPMIRSMSFLLALLIAGGNVLLSLSVLLGLVEVAA